MNKTRQELETHLLLAADALRAGAGAGEFGRLLYSPDLVVVGEGWPRAIRGLEAFMPDLSALLVSWGPKPDLTFTLIDPIFEGGDVATTLADVHVAPKSVTAVAEYYRVVYAWKRLAQGWRVAAEMYAVGSF